MSQPTTTYLVNNLWQQYLTKITYTLESLYLFLESYYKLVPRLKKLEKVCSSSFIYVSSRFLTLKHNVAVNSIFYLVTRIASPKLHLLISYLLANQFPFYFAYWINIIIFICTPRISAESYALLLSLGVATYWCHYEPFKVA